MSPVLLVKAFITFPLCVCACIHIYVDISTTCTLYVQLVGLSSLLPPCGLWIKLRPLGLAVEPFWQAQLLWPLEERIIFSFILFPVRLARSKCSLNAL